MSELNPLIGKTLTGVKIAEDREALLFQTEVGDIVVRADGDCCSQTWIESVELPARGFPAYVTAVEDLEMGDDTRNDSYGASGANPHKPSKHHEGGEVIAYYGVKISTDRGEIVIDYRNDSNGYYGGHLVWPGEDFYGGVYNQNASEMKWQDI